MSLNKERFYKIIQENNLFPEISVSQKKEIDNIINYYENNGLYEGRELAYIFATIYHETGKKVNGVFTRTMQPVEETAKGAGKKYGVTDPVTGKKYYGRGHTQNTWLDNYRKLTKLAKQQGKDWDFVNNPELLLISEISIWATFNAMELGLYTGKKLSNYFNDTTTDPLHARRIINSMDKAELIEGYYYKFLKAITG